MARSLTLGTLVIRCKARVPDGEGDESETDAEWKVHISEAYGELHAMLRAARHFESEATITATGASGYALPSDHLETITVDYVFTNNTRRRLRLLTAAERSQYAGLTGDAIGFALEGSNIVLYPNPSSGTYKHLYIPQPTDYSSSSDATTIDVINVHGEKFVLYGAAVSYANKRESQADAFVREREMARAEVEAWSADRILQHQRRPEVADDSTYYYDPYGYPPPWGWR